MKILITGGAGQLGRELAALKPDDMEVVSMTRDDLDITDEAGVDSTVRDIQADVIINAAAYTAVDRAESEPEAAHAANAVGPYNLATAARKYHSRLLHVSTDFVFDGSKRSPWLVDDPIAPLGVYGRTKAEGEMHVRAVHPQGSLILRTSWVYSVHGHNFVNTMLRLMNERDEVKVVADQHGAPTWSRNLAVAVWSLVKGKPQSGTYHWSDSGRISWYEFAGAIHDMGRALGLVQRDCRVLPIGTGEYPTAARRPAYSVLDISATEQLLGYAAQPWREALQEMLEELVRPMK